MQEALTGEIVMKDVSYETVKLLVAYSYGQVMINYIGFFMAFVAFKLDFFNHFAAYKIDFFNRLGGYKIDFRAHE